jgi:hypothetical protein
MRLLNKSHKLQSEIEAQERAKKRTFYQEEIATFHTQSYHSPPQAADNRQLSGSASQG